MSKFRLPSRFHRSGPLLAVGVTATLIALPGVAHAAPSLPTLPVTPGQVSAALPGPQSAACSRIVADDLTALFTDLATPPAQLPTSLDDVISALTAALGRPPTAAELVAALQALSPGSLGGVTIPAAGAGTNTGTQSVTNGSNALDKTSTGDTSGTGAVGGDAPAAALPAGDPSKVPGDLQQLATDFLQFCLPAPPSLPSLPSTPTSSSSSQQQSAQGASQPQPQAQVASQPTTQPAAQPVKYPGYAATGGIAPTLRPAGDLRSSDPVPLSVLGGVLLASTATAVGVRTRVRRGGR